MKNFTILIILTSSFVAQCQSFEIVQFEQLFFKSQSDQIDILYKKGFSKDVDVENVFQKKRFNNRTQSFEIEVVRLNKDTLTYSINAPDRHMKFKSKVEYVYKEKTETDNKVIFKRKKTSIKFQETVNQVNSTKKEILYVYSIYRT